MIILKFTKEQLLEIKDFFEYVKVNTTLKERKSLFTLSSVDLLLLFSFFYSIFEDGKDVDLIMYTLFGVGVTSGILGFLSDFYKKDYDKSKYKSLKRK